VGRGLRRAGSAACSPSRCGTARDGGCCLARDRVGVKPLYYAELPGRGIVFGSELKSLLEDPDVPRDWRPDAIDAYLTLLYIPAPASIYKAIHKLEPGHILVAERGTVRTKRYWDLEFTGDGDPRREEEYLEELDALLAESVALRQIADVPLGAFLSGGIDSSAVAAYLVETSARPPITISVGFDHAALRRARACAAGRGASRLRVPSAHGDARHRLPAAQARLAFRRPFADSSAVPTYYVSKAARELVTVALRATAATSFGPLHPHRVEQWEQSTRRVLAPPSAPRGCSAGRCPSP
jgi:asparagine synthase (glutamine-hydrolysing)